MDAQATPVVLLGEPLAVLASHPAPLQVATTFALSFGGSEFNTAIGLARLGHRARLATSLGTDVLSRRLIGVARAEGVELVSGAAAGKTLGAMFKDVGGAGSETFYLRNNSAFSAATEVDFAADILSGPTAWFHTSGITWAVNEPLTRAFLRRAARAGTHISVDVNLRTALHPPGAAQRMFAEISELCDILMLSLQEALAVTGRRTVEGAVGHISETVGRAIIRNGAESMVMIEAGVVSELPVVPVAEVDPIGAGDAFNAGFIAGTLQGMGMKDSCRLGAELAGEVVGVHGDWGFLPRSIGAPMTGGAVLQNAAGSQNQKVIERATWRAK